MKLTYRGVTYEYTPAAVEVTEGKLGGKYRGLDWRFCNLKKPLVQPATVDLKYRGVAYSTGEKPSSVQPAPVPAPVFSAEEKARVLMMNRHRVTENRQHAMLRRVAVEVGLVH